MNYRETVHSVSAFMGWNQILSPTWLNRTNQISHGKENSQKMSVGGHARGVGVLLWGGRGMTAKFCASGGFHLRLRIQPTL